ncbi:MAG: hypothetical protein ABFR53_01610 [Actinomycetota bacterium]
MFPRSFDRAYRRLVTAFKRHGDTARSPEAISVLGAARWELELARTHMAAERRALSPMPKSDVGVLRRTSISPDELARLRVFGSGTASS